MKKIHPELLKIHQKIQKQQAYNEKSNHLHHAEELIGKFFVSNHLSERIINKTLKNHWQKTVNAAIVKRTKNIFFRNNTLYLEINSCVLKNELAHKKTELLKELQKIKGIKIKKIVFV